MTGLRNPLGADRPRLARSLLFLAAFTVSAAACADTPLIPRSTLFGNPDKVSPQLSPDGSKLAFLAPADGVMNIWVAPAGDPSAAKAVTKDRTRGIRQYFWAFTNEHVIYTQDEGGDENWRVYSTTVSAGSTRDLTPFDEIRGPEGKPVVGPDGKRLRPAARIQEVSRKFPREILIAVNNRDPELHDVYRVNIESGEMNLVQKNERGAVGFLTDDDYRVRMCVRVRPDGGNEIERLGEDGTWSTFLSVPQTDALTTGPQGFAHDGKTLYMEDSRDRDTAALTAVDLSSGDTKVLAESAKADAGAVLRHPQTGEVQAVSFDYDRAAWTILDKSLEPDFAALRGVADGDLSVVSRTLDDAVWIVAFEMDNGPVRYYRYERAGKKSTFLFSNRSKLEGLALARMQSPIIRARDGLELVSYLTLPTTVELDAAGRPAKPAPMVLLVHGGPWGRDEWGYNSIHQWLANRGYAVLSVNFRGSTGFGKKFINAADLEWGRRMHDDLLDAVDWAVKQRIADPARVAIMGGSYGGYAALAGATLTPDKFACAVSIVGPSNLVTLLNSIPPYWKPMVDMFATRVGDPRTEDGRKLLLERSPLTHVDRIQRPLLIAQGANDPRVKRAESDQIVAAMKSKNIPVLYVLYPDEGHGFVRPENRMSFNAVTEAFLARHLGGRCEPIGDDFKGSTITVPVGAEQVSGLSEALSAAGPQ